MKEKCGFLNMHWYGKGDSCQCGQIPEDLFFSKACTCGAHSKFYSLDRDSRLSKYPKHSEDCAYIEWAKRRNEWIGQHPEVNPPIDKIRIEIGVT